jgi:hypothetical protein
MAARVRNRTPVRHGSGFASIAGMRVYYLCRSEDVSKTSGTGHVAEIAEFDDGSVVIRWMASSNATGVASTTTFNSLQDLLKVHGHEGRTVAEPAVGRDCVRRLEEMQRALDCAVNLLVEHGVPVPSEVRARAMSGSHVFDPKWEIAERT